MSKLLIVILLCGCTMPTAAELKAMEERAADRDVGIDRESDKRHWAARIRGAKACQATCAAGGMIVGSYDYDAQFYNTGTRQSHHSTCVCTNQQVIAK
jgi:hypothetical protein